MARDAAFTAAGDLFLLILNMSLTGAFVIAAICLARLPLRRAPKIVSYGLWAVAGFRLVFPLSIESFFSLIPFNAQPIPPDIGMQAVPRIDSGILLLNDMVSASLPAAAPQNSVNPLQIWIAIGALLWLLGALAMLVYGVLSYAVLRRKLRDAVLAESNIYETENIKSPFVLGIFSPRIYLPVGLSAQERRYILLHEQTHIRRRDHIVKFAAYFILCLHWFNPFAWLAFLLMGADMEMSCDERVLKEMGGETKKEYSMSLLSLATERRIIGGSPLAFGEGGVKERIKNVLNFKRPSRGILVAAVAFAAVLGAGFAMNRAGEAVNTADWASYEFQADHYDRVFFRCNDTPYNPEYFSISAQLMNNQDVPGLTCGTYFTLVKQVGASWKIVPFAEGTAPDDIAFPLENGMSFDYTIRPDMLANRLGEGAYRIVTDITLHAVEGEAPATHTVWADFTIDRNAPKSEIFSIPAEWYGNFDGKDMTLDDVRALAAKGVGLQFDDLRPYRGANFSSSFDRYVMVYGVAGGYRLVVHAGQTGAPDSVNLESVWAEGGSGIDIRYNDVDAFLQAQPSQDAIPEKEAQDMAQSQLCMSLAPVSWEILGEWPERTDADAAFARALLDSMEAIGEPCWVFRIQATAEWGGLYYAVGKKSGAIFMGGFENDGPDFWVPTDISH